MSTRNAIATITLLTGLIAVGWWARTPGAPEPGRIDSLSERLDHIAESHAADPEVVAILKEMQAALAEQAAHTRALARKVASLEAGTPLVATAFPEEEVPNGADPADSAEEQDSPAFGGRRWGVDVERLVDAGVNPTDAAEIVAEVDQLTLERLQLRFEATRDGRLNTPEYREAISEIPSAREYVQDTYGSDVYDRYLYASGRPNRVVVTDVLRDSPAQQIGLRPGDVLIGLGDERIYSTRDIMAIASSGTGNLPLTVRRDGQLLQYYVDAGPLGIRSHSGYENPDLGGK
ncbi:MAG: PDZ domain-containing protein [Pseudomonadales bacterium]